MESTLRNVHWITVSLQAVIGLLAFVTSDLDPLNPKDAEKLLNVPAIPLMCSELVKFSSDTSPFMVDLAVLADNGWTDVLIITVDLNACAF